SPSMFETRPIEKSEVQLKKPRLAAPIPNRSPARPPGPNNAHAPVDATAPTGAFYAPGMVAPAAMSTHRTASESAAPARWRCPEGGGGDTQWHTAGRLRSAQSLGRW